MSNSKVKITYEDHTFELDFAILSGLCGSDGSITSAYGQADISDIILCYFNLKKLIVSIFNNEFEFSDEGAHRLLSVGDDMLGKEDEIETFQKLINDWRGE